MINAVDSNLYLYCLIFWVVGLGLTVFLTRAKKTLGVGLPALFLAMMFLNHWFGALVCYLPWYRPDPLWNKPNHVALTYEGFYQATVGVAGFLMGCLILAPFLIRKTLTSDGPQDPNKIPAVANLNIKAGLLCYVLMAIGAGLIGSATSLLTAGFNLILAGMTLYVWRGNLLNNPTLMRWPVLIAAAFPFFTLITQGFLGFGVSYFIVVAAFYAHFHGLNIRWLIATPIILYLGLTFFVTYMRDRSTIRDSVWGERGVQSTTDRVFRSASTFEWFDLQNNKHLERINSRLNQNSLVGSSVQYIERTGKYADGETLWTALVALIPRALWPNKPISAGSGNLVTRYTGIKFAEGTSVAIGMIMEFYVNFGTACVFIGLLVVGFLIRLLDTHAGSCLKAGDYGGFATGFLAGLSLLNVNGSMVEITVCFVASIVVTKIATYWIGKTR